jgi:hypothetical protein
MAWKRSTPPGRAPFFKFERVGQTIEGLLGAPKPINGNACYQFQIIAPKELRGPWILPSHLRLNEALEFHTAGAYLRITREASIPIKGRERPMFSYSVYEDDGEEETDSDDPGPSAPPPVADDVEGKEEVPF